MSEAQPPAAPAPTPTPEVVQTPGGPPAGAAPPAEPFVSPLAQPAATPAHGVPDAISAVEQQALDAAKAAKAASYGWGREDLNELDQGWIENKGFGSATDIVNSYRLMEKQQGADPESLLRIPGENATPEERAAFATKLGRPSEAAGYQFTTESPEDVVDITGDMREWAFGCDMSQHQAEYMHSRYQAKVREVAQEMTESRHAEARRDDMELQREWGPDAYKTNMHAASRFIQKMNITSEEQDGIEQILGFKRTAELEARMGRSMGEHAGPGDGLEDSGSELDLGMTPEAAKQRINELQGDPEFWARYVKGDVAARKRFADLHTVAHPQGSDMLSIARR